MNLSPAGQRGNVPAPGAAGIVVYHVDVKTFGSVAPDVLRAQLEFIAAAAHHLQAVVCALQYALEHSHLDKRFKGYTLRALAAYRPFKLLKHGVGVKALAAGADDIGKLTGAEA